MIGFYNAGLGNQQLGGLPSDSFTTPQYALGSNPGSSSPVAQHGRFAGSPSKVLIAALLGYAAWRALSYAPSLDLRVGNMDLNVYNTVGFLIMYSAIWGAIKVFANLVPLGIVTDYINFL